MTEPNTNQINKYFSNPTKKYFDQLPSTVQSLLYRVALNCKDRHEPCVLTKRFFDRLLVQAGIYGRKELTKKFRINPAQRIPDGMKACLKVKCVKDLLIRFCLGANKVFFYDDKKEIVDAVSDLGVNSTYVGGNALASRNLQALINVEKFLPGTIEMVLIDFDRTLSRTKFKKKYLRYGLKTFADRYFGGVERVNELRSCIKELEILGVKIGFITFHSRDDILATLVKIGWVSLDYDHEIELSMRPFHHPESLHNEANSQE